MSSIEKIRKQRDLPLEVLAEVTGIPASRLEDIERGEKRNRKEETLLERALGVPRYAFLQKRALVDRLPTDFRTVGNLRPRYGLRGLQAIYDMQSLAKFADAIGENIERSGKFKEVRAEIGDIGSPPDRKVLSALAELTGYDLNSVLNKYEPSVVFQSIRQNLEDNDFFVVCERLDKETYRGFCIYRERYPLVFINTFKQNPRIRIFTLIHEAVHLLLRRDGIIDPFNRRNQIEKICNKLTVEFLLPTKLFREIALAKRSRDSRSWIDALAKEIPLSKFVIALRIQEVLSIQGFANKWLQSFQSHSEGWNAISTEDFDLTEENGIAIDEMDASEKLDAIRPRNTKASHQVRKLGDGVLSFVGSALKSGIITKYDVYDQLNVKTDVIGEAIDKAAAKRRRTRKI
jgi:Zn-dependent peptidase ImmA (M78 family)